MYYNMYIFIGLVNCMFIGTLIIDYADRLNINLKL